MPAPTEDPEEFQRLVERLKNGESILDIFIRNADSKGVTIPDDMRMVFRVRAELTRESDRGCALLGAVLLDDALGELLRANFVDDAKAADEILKDGGSLGTFSARINMCFCLGLIDIETMRTLHLIRKIRNAFAHDLEASFSNKAIIQRCDHLYKDPLRPDQKPRHRFSTNVVIVAGEIHAATWTSKRPTSPESGRDEMARWVEKNFEAVFKSFNSEPADSGATSDNNPQSSYSPENESALKEP